MELITVNQRTSQRTPSSKELEGDLSAVESKETAVIPNPFIEANTKAVELNELKEACIIPVFAKDNERTISHQEFIEQAYQAALTCFPGVQIQDPEIRVSHQIKGRVPGAIHKSAKELLDHEKTQYYERMAFIIRIDGIREQINGNSLSLVIGGVRAYNQENLYSKKSLEKFKFFIGFQNMVCCNLCVTTDGLKEDFKTGSVQDLSTSMTDLITGYRIERELEQMQTLRYSEININQFAQILGKLRLYNHLPKLQKQEIPNLSLTDVQMNAIARDFYNDQRFCVDQNGKINLWKVYNLFTSANKSSYIDTFLSRNVNALSFTQGLAQVLKGEGEYEWYLN